MAQLVKFAVQAWRPESAHLSPQGAPVEAGGPLGFAGQPVQSDMDAPGLLRDLVSKNKVETNCERYPILTSDLRAQAHTQRHTDTLTRMHREKRHSHTEVYKHTNVMT